MIMPIRNFRLLRQGGFSLVELLIALGIIALVAAVSVPNLRKFNKDQELDGAVSKFVSILKTAQSSASSGIQCPNGVVAANWQVLINITATPDRYTMKCLPLGALGPMVGSEITAFDSPFAASQTSSNVFSAVTDRCGAGVNATIFFTNNGVAYQCTSGTLQTTTTIKTTVSTAGTLKIVDVEPGGIIRIE